MKKWGAIIGGLLLIIWAGWEWHSRRWVSPLGRAGEKIKLELEAYDFDTLRERGGRAGKLEIRGRIKEVEERRINDKREAINEFETRQIRFLSQGKWITGMMNYRPEKSSPSGVIIMIRGYAESRGYYSGSGTWKVADELVGQRPDLATISIDFLGYGGSDNESGDILIARFEKVVSVLDLIESVKQLPWVDKNRIGMWAHSNGGQIALSVLEITGAVYPTVLWAPMTLAFPQSVLGTAETPEIRQVIEKFEQYYDARRYAFENYLEWIKAPILILQGDRDEWVKVEWQEKLVRQLADLGKEAELVVYSGSDHNLSHPPAGGWDRAAERTRKWYWSKRLIQ